MTQENATVVSINEGAPALPMNADAMKIQQMGIMSYNDLAHKYRLLVDTEGVHTIAQIVAPGVLKTVTKEDVITVELVKRWGSVLRPSQVKTDVFPRWYAEMRTREGVTLPHANVKPFHFKSDSLAAGWAWQRLPFDPLPGAPAPKLFEVLMGRTSPEEALSVKLFIGSLFDYKSSRHQYLYLHGDGGDGKSTLIASMFAMFANRGCRTMKGDTLDGTHATASLEGVRLLAFPDCNRPGLPSTGIFKELTGDNTTSINPKGQAMRNITVHCKVVISSNDAPALAGGKADERRILPVRFERKETTASQAWVDEFVASAPQIAQHCISVYSAWRAENPDSDIPTASSAIEMVRENSTQALASDLADRIFEFGEGKFTRASALHEAIKRATKGDDRLCKQVIKVLGLKGLASKSHRVNGEVLRGWAGVGLRTMIVHDV